MKYDLKGMYHDNRGTSKFPYGFIYFSDGVSRIRYAALSTEKDSDAWGLPKNPDFPLLYIMLARQYVEENLILPIDAWPVYEAQEAAKAAAAQTTV